MLGVVDTFEKGERILLLAASKAAISAIKNAGTSGKARTADHKYLIEAIDSRRRGHRDDETVAVGWVKSHIGIKGIEMADRQAKIGAGKRDRGEQVTEGGG